MAERELCLAPAPDIDRVLDAAFPEQGDKKMGHRRLGRLLLDAGALTGEDLAWALEEQSRSGGRLGGILLAYDLVTASTMTAVLAEKLDLPTLKEGERPVALLPAQEARLWRAVALSSARADLGESVLSVAFADPSPEIVEAVARRLRLPVKSLRPVLTDDQTLDALLGTLYAEEDVNEVTNALFKSEPDFSAYRNGLSPPQLILVGAVVLLLVIGLLVNAYLTVVIGLGLGSLIYVLYAIFRFYSTWQGWKAEDRNHPSPEDLQSLLDERELPVYTILVPIYKEKPTTMRALFEALSKLDYPKHKLDGLLLMEDDDEGTREAIATVGKPGWLKILRVPPGNPRTKPKAMAYGLLYAKGELLTIYDAEDQPDPHQLKEAVWAFKEAEEDVVCLQARLNYYNPRQNLLTRWFTLEYSAWFDLFLPGLHRMEAPIPLGGTSCHFRTDALEEALSWDPYNVTEDADLGLRLFRVGKKTAVIVSTTYEEANSKVMNWLRQRSRWIKGYMQTFLVHTRYPSRLYQELGLKNTLIFLATTGGLIYTVLLSPIFWSLLALWVLFQPGWVSALFPVPIYYLALVSLFIGNFFFIFLGLVGAVDRGMDDFAPHTLLMPFYWLLMSVAGYLALYELVFKPHHWHKTEHGLHFEEEEPEELPVHPQEEPASEISPIIVEKGGADHTMGIFRRLTPRTDGNTEADGKALGTEPARALNPAVSNEGIVARLGGDLGDDIAAVGDYRKQLDRESEAMNNFIQDLREHVEQISSRRGRLEEDTRELSELCEKLEQETAEVSSLQTRIRENESRIQELLEQHRSE